MRYVFVKCMILIAMLSLSPYQSWAYEDDSRSILGSDLKEFWHIVRGGKLYDKWWEELELEVPNNSHPAYPATGKQKGPATWRCKECHGWDYKGNEGAYASGSHATGIIGLREMAGIDPEIIQMIIMDDTHRYFRDLIPRSATQKIALFVSKGQIDMDVYIDRKTKTAIGDPRRGARFYHTVCAVCHGIDGKLINFGDEKKPEYLGTVGVNNPWEVLHKIRFGQPGMGMVALTMMDVKDQVDILSYVQTLPVD